MEAIDDESQHRNVGLAETCREEPTLVDSILTGCDDQHEGRQGLGDSPATRSARLRSMSERGQQPVIFVDELRKAFRGIRS
jgi:hypothetical protein